MDTTNYLHHTGLEDGTLSPLPEQHGAKPANHTAVLLIAIVLLLLSNISSIGYILFLYSRLQGISQAITSMQGVPSLIGQTATNPLLQQNTIGAGLIPHLPSLNSTPNPTVAAIQAAAEQKLNQMQQSGGGNIYTVAIGQANDTKRHSDLNNLASALNIYLIDKGELPKNFPDVPKCIGTEVSCFDLYSILIPNYLDSPLLDPTKGTTGNSGYLIGQAHDGNRTFIARAIDSTGNVLEVTK